VPCRDQPACRAAGGVRARRSAVGDELHPLLARVPVGAYSSRHRHPRPGCLLHVDGSAPDGGHPARRPLSVGQPHAVQEHQGAVCTEPMPHAAGVHTCACACAVLTPAGIPKQHGAAQVGPFPAVQEQVYGPSAGLFVVPEAAQTRQNGVEAASLQQLCLDAARRQLQPSTVCSILQVSHSLKHSFPRSPIGYCCSGSTLLSDCAGG
jgi:hypothetical protein